jgi:hypothetical protein
MTLVRMCCVPGGTAPSDWIYSIDRLQTVSDVPRPLQLLGLTAIVLTVVIVLLLTGGRRSRKVALPTTVAPGWAVADFALLRSAPEEPLSRRYLKTVQRLPASFELVPSEARESRGGVWLIPGRYGLCLLVVDSEGPGGSCNSLEAAESEGVSFHERNARSGQERWTGAVPDGTVRVRALAADGATLAVAAPRSSIYRLTARNVEKVSAER